MTSKGSVLTPDTIREAIEHMNSEDYEREVFRTIVIKARAEITVGTLYDREEITKWEYWKYMNNIAMNGMLVLHPEDNNLRKFQKELECLVT